MHKIGIGPYLTLTQYVNGSKKDLNSLPKSMNLLEENIGYSSVAMDLVILLCYKTKITGKREKSDKLYFIKFKICVH